ncbi:MAG: hypothetical protein K6B72_03655 [Lachnospiraceae bacterium]|nr:hypothetical protein [Lachnospiraceae bacterium]
MKKKKRIPVRKDRIRAKSTYDTAHFDVEDLLELDEEESLSRDDADDIDDEEEEDEPEDVIEDLAESPDAEDYDRAGTEETLTEEPEKPVPSGEEEDLLTEEQVRDFTQSFEKLPADISDLEEGEPVPEEYDAYEDDYGDEEDDREKDRHDGRDDWDDIDDIDEDDEKYDEDYDEYDENNETDEDDEDVEEADRRYRPKRTSPHRGTARRRRRGQMRRPKKKADKGEKKRSRLTPAEWMAIGMSAVLVIAAVSLGIYFVRMQKKNTDMASFQEIGADLSGVRIIGESGLIAMRDEAAVRLAEAEGPEEEEVVEEEEVEPEETLAEAVEINMTLTTIKSDLKIKFVNAQTGKLIANVPFEVTAKAPDGKAETWQDDDRDGIIYRKGIAAGVWSITMSELSGEYAQQYTVHTAPQTAKVKETIEYKKVDVKEEIKKESEVNVAVEDTQPKEAAAVESVNVDTVEWVESSREEYDAGDGTVTYEKVKTEDLAVPQTTASLKTGKRKGTGRMLSEPADPTAGESAQTGDTAPESSSQPEEAAGGGTTAAADGTSLSAESGTSEAAEAGSTAGTGATSQASSEASTGATSDAGAGSSPSANTGTSSSATGASSGSTGATVSGNAASTAASAAASSASTAASNASTASSAASTGASIDKNAPLKTKSGEPVYVKNGDEYRLATVGDYSASATFYKKVPAKKYIYHGWQTIDGRTYYYDKNGNYVTGEQTILGVKYKFSSEGVLSSGSGELGVDVSKWNGSIDWNAVKNSGVTYAIIRCGYRGTSSGVLVEDPTFRTNMKGALNAGLKVGVYFFSAAVNDVEAVEEASMAASLCSGYKLTYPVFLDVERSSGGGRADNLSSGERTAVIKAFCATMANSGYRTGVYSNKNWFEEKIDTPSLTGYKIWLAQYAAAPTYGRTRYDMWQYTSKGTIGGISGKVDLNISYLGY